MFLDIKKDIFSDLKDNLFNLLRKFRCKRCNAEDAELRAINFCCAEDAQICVYKRTCCVVNPRIKAGCYVAVIYTKFIKNA